MVGIVIDLHPLMFIILYLIISLLIYIFYYKKKEISKKKFYLVLTFAFYCLCIFKLVILPIEIWFEHTDNYIYLYYQIIPFATIQNIFSSNLKLFIVQVVGNILLLLPIPIFLKFLTKHGYEVTFKRSLLIVFLSSLFIEIIQLIINILTRVPNKVADIDDLILNVLGGIIGWFIYKGIEYIKPNFFYK